MPATSPVVLSLFKSGGSTALVARLYVSGASETMTALAGALGLSVAAVSRIVATAERDALVSVTKVRHEQVRHGHPGPERPSAGQDAAGLTITTAPDGGGNFVAACPAPGPTWRLPRVSGLRYPNACGPGLMVAANPASPTRQTAGNACCRTGAHQEAPKPGLLTRRKPPTGEGRGLRVSCCSGRKGRP